MIHGILGISQTKELKANHQGTTTKVQRKLCVSMGSHQSGKQKMTAKNGISERDIPIETAFTLIF